MLQSVLSAIPSYPMSSFLMPVSLCKRLQSAVTRYWWDQNENERKMAWVAWDSIAKPKAIGGLGMREFQNFNIALLAKIGWRLLQNPNCLLGRVLFGKYCQDSNILQAEETSTMSHGWRGILKGRDLLLKNLGWIVGNGDSISIWNDPWLSLTCQQRPMGPPNEAHQDLTVADLINAGTGEWDVPKIKLLLPAYEEKILSINPSLTGAPDKQVWLGTRSGTYSTKSGYYTAVNQEENGEIAQNNLGFQWKSSVWNLTCAPKIKLFSWRLLKGAIPVGERLVDRHVPADPACKRCGCSESIIHLLFQCPFAQRVWSLAPLMTDMDVSGIIDLMNSWDGLCALKCLPPAGITSSTLVPWILWSLWKARNKFVFEGHSASPEDTLTTAIVLAREWSTEVKKESSVGLKRPILPALNPRDTVVIRSDAAWASVSNEAGLGWIILSTTGNRSFMKTTKCVVSSLSAEGLALREAVRTCASLGLKKVAFESDSALLIKAVKSESSTTELYSLVSDILSYASVFEFVVFSWIPREKNMLADCLAKDALKAPEPLVVGDALTAPN